MPKTKTQAEAPEKKTAAPVIEKQPETPEKQAGPMSAARTMSPALPPPNGAPSPARAAGLLAAPEVGPGTLGRARMMTAMQGTMGNARLGRMLSTAPSPVAPAIKPPTAPERAQTVAPEEIPQTFEAPPVATPRARATSETDSRTLKAMEVAPRQITPATEASPAPAPSAEMLPKTAFTKTTAPAYITPESAEAPPGSSAKTMPAAVSAENIPQPTASTTSPTAMTQAEIPSEKTEVPPEAPGEITPAEVATESPLETTVEAAASPAGAPESVAGTGPAAADEGGVTSGMPAAGIPGAPEAGAPSAPPTIDSGSSEALLQSLATVPASSMDQAMTMAKASVPQIQAQEKADLESSFPKVERPTGLPRLSEREVEAEPTVLERGEVSEPVTPRGHKEAEPDTHHEEARGPVPGSQVSTAAPEPRDNEEGGSWWSWLVNRVRNFLTQLPTRDPGLSTSAGPRPTVDVTGEADPGQNERQQQVSDQEVTTHRAQADAATAGNFGENDIYPTVPSETLRPTYKPEPPPSTPGGGSMRPPSVTDDVRGALDQTASPWLGGKVNEQIEQERQDRTGYQQQSQKIREEGRNQIAQENARVRSEQEGMQQQARNDVDDQRESWREENQKIQENYANKSETKRAEIDQKIHHEVQSAETRADTELTNAETMAEEERRKAEAKAAEEKRKAKKKRRGFWARVKGAVSDAFKAIKEAVNAIFDALRKLVKKIIEKAKALVRGIIELARRAIVGLIKAFGEFVKGLVTVALAAFPEAAAKTRAWIDRRVDTAVDAVNRAAEALKKATDAILDWVGGALDFALSVYQKAYNVILDVIEFVVVGLIEIMEKIGQLVSAAREMPDHFEGQMYEELIGSDLTQPLPFELTEPPSAEAAATAAAETGELSPANAEFATRPELSEAEIEVDNVAPLELEPELLASLDLQDGAEIEFGENPDPANSIAAIQAELAGTQTAEGAPPEEIEEAAPTAVGLTAAEGPASDDTEARLQALMDQEPEGACTKEKPQAEANQSTIPEHLKFGPLTKEQRARYLLDQMWKGIKQWFACNWPWLLAAVIAALVGIIALEIITGGAITAALPIILQIIAVVLIGVAVVRMATYFGEYLGKGWAGDVTGGAKSLARGLAIGAIELVFAVLFALTGGIFNALKAALKATMKVAARAATAAGRGLARGARAVGRGLARGGRAVGRAVTHVGGATIRRGKIVMQGVRRGFARGARSLQELAERLWRRVRFRKFKLRMLGQWIELLGYINPWIPLARLRAIRRRLGRHTEVTGGKIRIRGFRNTGELLERVGNLRNRLRGVGIDDAEIGIRGSAVTGVSSKGGGFRELPGELKPSDVDFFFTSSKLETRIDRIAPGAFVGGRLRPATLRTLEPNLADVLDEFANQTTRQIGRKADATLLRRSLVDSLEEGTSVVFGR